IDEVVRRSESLAAALLLSGVPAKHPWRGCERDTLNVLDQERLTEHIRTLATSLNDIGQILAITWPVVRPAEVDWQSLVGLDDLSTVAEALDLAGSKPNGALALLCSRTWATKIADFGELVSTARRLDEIRNSLANVFVEEAWLQDWKRTRSE